MPRPPRHSAPPPRTSNNMTAIEIDSSIAGESASNAMSSCWVRKRDDVKTVPKVSGELRPHPVPELKASATASKGNIRTTDPLDTPRKGSTRAERTQLRSRVSVANNYLEGFIVEEKSGKPAVKALSDDAWQCVRLNQGGIQMSPVGRQRKSRARTDPPPRVLQGALGVCEGNSDAAPEGTVFLNVYDIGGDAPGLRSVGWLLKAVGAFHAGVEVYEDEYGYGYTPEGGTGVSTTYGRLHPDHVYRSSVPLGVIDLPKDEVEELVHRLSNTWLGKDYNVLHRNCLMFCSALCRELDVASIPPWVDRSARAAGMIDWTIRSSYRGVRDVVQSLVVSPLAPSSSSEIGSEKKMLENASVSALKEEFASTTGTSDDEAPGRSDQVVVSTDDKSIDDSVLRPPPTLTPL
eukprot:TRINITY_DN44224_c0_g1_i1.p1 TRINITY_DN44224_c0_g1~~TRINITY_DN44224_c0_g1_i1.p1  ORF type:complete len:405 (-),score=55.62 TRINITY_DN44224_c0_g1_i1:16-1230(-)